MLSFFPQGVLDEILNLIESVSEGFPSYSLTLLHLERSKLHRVLAGLSAISAMLFCTERVYMLE